MFPETGEVPAQGPAVNRPVRIHPAFLFFVGVRTATAAGGVDCQPTLETDAPRLDRAGTQT